MTKAILAMVTYRRLRSGQLCVCLPAGVVVPKWFDNRPYTRSRTYEWESPWVPPYREGFWMREGFAVSVGPSTMQMKGTLYTAMTDAEWVEVFATANELGEVSL